MFWLQGFPQKRIFHEIDLSHREVICRAPVSVYQSKFIGPGDCRHTCSSDIAFVVDL